MINVWKDGKQILISKEKLVDPILAKELDIIKHRVLTKDRDWVVGIDGEEGVGKSIFGQQVARYLDDNFNIDNICFTADELIARIKDPNIKKGSAIILDEAFAAANARAAMTEVNRSLIGVATEMRQKNLFILIILPSFFDLDRYFALWRCRSLFHLYFTENEDRRYIIFPKEQKKYLYLYGKKTYNYSKPRSPYPPMVFPHLYVVDEAAYRLKKANAFNKRKVSNQAKKWLGQRDAYIKELSYRNKVSQEELASIPQKYGAEPLSQRGICDVLEDYKLYGGDVPLEIAVKNHIYKKHKDG